MKFEIIITAILCITLLEIVALSMGIDGTLLTMVVAALAGLAGLATKTPKILKDEW